VHDGDEKSKFKSTSPQVSPIDSLAMTSSCSSNNDNVAPDNRQRHPDGSDGLEHHLFSIRIESNENSPPRSTSQKGVVVFPSLVCEKVVESPSSASDAYFVERVDDCIAFLLSATFTFDDMACSSNIWICAPVVDSSLTFLALGEHESICVAGVAGDATGLSVAGVSGVSGDATGLSVHDDDNKSKFKSTTPQVSPIDSLAMTSSCSFNNDNVAPDNRQRHPSVSDGLEHHLFSIRIESKENTPPRSTSQKGMVVFPSLVCEKVVESPSSASDAYFVERVDDCIAFLLSATFTLDDMACSSNIWICAPVVDSSLTFLALGEHESICVAGVAGDATGFSVHDDEKSKFKSTTPQVSPIDLLAMTSSCSSNNEKVAPDNRQRHPSVSDGSEHHLFSIRIESKENTPPRSTSQKGVVVFPSLVCEKVVESPSSASDAYFVLKVEDWLAALFSATFTLDDMACSSNIWICSPVVDSSLTFLATG
jgi:hypothetical protein